MQRIREMVKQKSKHYQDKRVYCGQQVKYFVFIAFILIAIGLFVEYGYYSTIGHLGQKIAFEIFKIHFIKLVMILSYAVIIDLLFAFIIGIFPKSFKKLLNMIYQRQTFLFSMFLILMFSLDAPVSVFCTAITLMAIWSQNTKDGHAFYRIHPVLIGYLVGFLGIIVTNSNLGLIEVPPMLSAPYLEVTNSLHPMTFDTFRHEYYSFMTVVSGLYEGSLCFTLIIPLLLCSLFLMKRRSIDYKVTGLYLLLYVLLGGGLGFILNQSFWVIGLFLLNGSVLMTGLFFLPDHVTLEQYDSIKYIYVISVAILSVLACYFIHFILGPYIALAIVQLIILSSHLIKRLINKK